MDVLKVLLAYYYSCKIIHSFSAVEPSLCPCLTLPPISVPAHLST
uniref:Uncharacterized protein n=1 Tax=Anguilla anguilla TaxID=7936 RepID=A0A0E9XPV8_ANGAN